MNSEERHQARYERRKAQRERVRREKLAEFDNFERIADVNSLIRANFDSRRGVMWKASVARYNMHFYKNAVKAHYDLMAGKNIHSGYYSFGIIERALKAKVLNSVLTGAKRTCTNISVNMVAMRAISS